MSENKIFAAMDLKEEVKKQDILNRHLGYSWSEKTVDFLDYLNNEWESISNCEDLDGDFCQSSLVRKIVSQEVSKILTKAIKDGDLSQLKCITGYNKDKGDFSSLNRFKKLIGRVCRDGYSLYVFGEVGSGKTDFALLLSELWRIGKNGEVGSNIRSFEEKDEFIGCFSDLKDWLSDNGDRLFVFDEASSYAGGYGKQGYKAKKLIKLLKKFRKYNASIIIVGHTGKDVHPEIRRLCHDLVEKRDKKVAKFWSKLSDGEGKNLKLEIKDVPETTCSYDTNEITDWNWE